MAAEPAHTARAIRGLARHLSIVIKAAQPPDVVLGAAGNLIAVSLLKPWLPEHAALDCVAEQLAEQVAHAIWAHEGDWSFAHGWPGMAFALLQAAHARKLPPADELLARLRSLAARDALERPGLHADMRHSWCNGAAGRILLWVKAFEMTADPRFVQRARADAEAIPHGHPTNHMLCCGTTGWAYAFLALERVTGDRAWYERALRMCAHSIDSNPAFEHASGLLKGYSGLLYLSIDLLRYTRSCGFPFVEALPMRPP